MSAPDKGVAVSYLMLIAGDDSWVTELVSALERAGHRLTVVPSVAEAITAADEEAPALAIADATVVVPMDFLRLPLIAAVGGVVYGEPLEWPVLAGATIMFCGNFISIRAEQKRLKALNRNTGR